MDTHIDRIRKTADGLQVQFVGSRRVGRFPWWWLRDHGEDPESRDPETGQRRIDTFSIPSTIRPTAVAVHPSRTKVAARWPEGPPTLHTAGALAEIASNACRLLPASSQRLQRPPSRMGVGLWSTSAPAESIQPFDYSEVLRAGQTTERWLRHIWHWGFAVLDRVPPGRSPVKEIAAQIGYVRETIFGGVWELSSEVTDHQDSAYNTTFLAPHTDGTYSHDGPGLQLFSCQEREGEGGDSILTDGFAAVARLMDSHPHHVDVLSRAPVIGHYREPGVDLRAQRPPLRFDAQGHLRQVSFNNYDRAPLLFQDSAEGLAFREAYAALWDLLSDDSSWLYLPWKPGQTLIFDNWRILHGRQSFTGRRRFFGAYTNHEDFESNLRVGKIES